MKCALALVLMLIWSASSAAKIIDQIAAQVNDQIITLSDLRQFRKDLKSKQFTDELLIPNDDVRKSLLKNQSQLLDILIDEKLMDSEIKKENLTVPAERVEEAIRDIAHKFNLTQAQFRRAIQQQGLSMDQYRNNVKSHLERQALISKAITSRVKVSDGDVISYYLREKHQDATQIYSYKLADIVFPIENGDEQSALSRAQKVLLRLKQDNNQFASLADEINDGAGGKGGLLGTFQASEMSKGFQRVVPQLQVGEISGIVKSRSSYHILRLLDRELVPNPEFEQRKEEIRKLLTDKAYKKEFQFWLTQKRQSAYIQKNI